MTFYGAKCEPSEMKCLLLTRFGRLGASSRIRSLQYLPILAREGIRIDHHALLSDRYLRIRYLGKRPPISEIARGYAVRLARTIKARTYDVVWIEKEIFPFLPAWFEHGLLSSRTPLLLDYDDPTFHTYDEHSSFIIRRILGGKIRSLMKRAALVVAANEYLAHYAREAGARCVEKLPTAVDLDRYTPGEPTVDDGILRIGWIGTPITTRYLRGLAGALRNIAQRRRIRLITIGGEVTIDGVDVEFRPWSETSEVDDILGCDVGIMPLPDERWAHGKSGYKLIQYMACAKPVIASPVGINEELVREGQNGFLARSESEWCEKLDMICGDRARRIEMGRAGRSLVEEQYCLQVTSARLILYLRQAASSK